MDPGESRDEQHPRREPKSRRTVDRDLAQRSAVPCGQAVDRGRYRRCRRSRQQRQNGVGAEIVRRYSFAGERSDSHNRRCGEHVRDRRTRRRRRHDIQLARSDALILDGCRGCETLRSSDQARSDRTRQLAGRSTVGRQRDHQRQPGSWCQQQRRRHAKDDVSERDVDGDADRERDSRSNAAGKPQADTEHGEDDPSVHGSTCGRVQHAGAGCRSAEHRGCRSAGFSYPTESSGSDPSGRAVAH